MMRFNAANESDETRHRCLVAKIGNPSSTVRNFLLTSPPLSLSAWSLSPSLWLSNIASGVPPQNGLYCGIVTAFVISALGGSKTQIVGLTGAFSSSSRASSRNTAWKASFLARCWPPDGLRVSILSRPRLPNFQMRFTLPKSSFLQSVTLCPYAYSHVLVAVPSRRAFIHRLQGL